MTNFALLKCPVLDGVEQTIKNLTESIQEDLELLSEKQEYADTREFVNASILSLLACRHLVGKAPLSSEMLVANGSRVSVEYFDSDWRKRFPDIKNQVAKKKGNDELQWFQMFRQGLLFSSLAGANSALVSLGNWAEPWLELDPYPYSPDPLYGKLYVLIARQYRSARAWDATPLQQELAKSRKKGPKLLYQLWESVLAKNQQEFDRLVGESVQQFEKSLGEIRSYVDCLDLDTSIVVALAKHGGMRLPLLEPRIAARLMTTESLGL